MKQYKVTIANGDYPLSCTCNTIADAYECLLTLESWVPNQWTGFARCKHDAKQHCIIQEKKEK